MPSQIYKGENKQIKCACGCGKTLLQKDKYGRNRKAIIGHHNRNKGLKKFWDMLKEDSNGCWNWTGCKTNKGYGDLQVDGKRYLAHRLSYELEYGVFDKNMEILHLCDNPLCCNPKHLKLGTHLENMHDAIIKGRMITGKNTFSDNDISKIRKLYFSTKLSQHEIAKIFKTHPSYICRIVNNKRRRENQNVTNL